MSFVRGPTVRAHELFIPRWVVGLAVGSGFESEWTTDGVVPDLPIQVPQDGEMNDDEDCTGEGDPRE